MSHNIWDSAWQTCTQAPPPALADILAAYAQKGDGDREMLLRILNAKSAEDQRIAEVAALHRTILEIQAQSHPPSSQPRIDLPSLSSTSPRPTLPPIHHLHHPSSPPPKKRQRASSSESSSTSSHHYPLTPNSTLSTSPPPHYPPRSAGMNISSLLSKSKQSLPHDLPSLGPRTSFERGSTNT